MRRISASAFVIALLASWLITADIHGQGQKPQAPTAPVNAPRYGDYDAAEIRILTPGVVFASGLPDLAEAYTKQTGKKIGIVTVGMGTISGKGLCNFD